METALTSTRELGAFTLASRVVTKEKQERLRTLFEGANAENTKLTYNKQLQGFLRWCRANDVEFDLATSVVTPELLVDHIEDLHHQGYKLDTIKSRVRAIAALHKAQAFAFEKLHGKEGLLFPPSPTAHFTVTTALRGAKNSIAEQEQAGNFEQAKKKALTLWHEDLVRLCKGIDTNELAGARDLALVLVGWCGGFRRSELVGVRVEHIEHHPWGLVVTVHKTKTGKPYKKQLKREAEHEVLCPVRALEAWLQRAGIEEGVVFRPVNKASVVGSTALCDKQVELVVKKYAKRAPLRAGKWSAHSLRRGYVSQHLAWGLEEQDVRRQAGFSPKSPVFYEYVEEAKDKTTVRSSVSGNFTK
jgi:site-specific recombinase XerD